MRWQQRLTNDEIVVIDGATGTELQRRGVAMDEVAWSGAAVLSHPEVVRAVHEDYIRAGAEVIIANTFGSTRQMLQPAGFGDHVETVNRQAIQLAIEARTNLNAPDVAVAGSISAMPPSFDRDAYFSPEQELESYREAVRIQVEAGCDLIALEMMEDTQHAERAMRAAVEAGVPVWLGVSCRQSEAGTLVGFGRPDVALNDVLEVLLPMQPAVVNVMHTCVDAIDAALRLLRQKWDGPVGVYPESGYFAKPNWEFVDVIPPRELVRVADEWIQHGTRLVGGCCGTGPDHIRALRSAFGSS